ncbi:MAG: SRPBCC family protein [Myxococcota bacterium]
MGGVPEWLAPATGVVALGSGVALVGLYAYGRSVPETHHTEVHATIPEAPDAAWALAVDWKQRPTWRPDVARIGEIDDIAGRPTWRELDPGGDRFDFSIETEVRPTLVLVAARPEDLGMEVRWTWTIEPAPGATGEEGTRITIAEDASIDNELFRGWWALTVGPYAAIEPDLAAFTAALGHPAVPER